MAPKSIAFVAALLATLPAEAIGQSVCREDRALTPCEIELYDAGVVWETRAFSTHEKLRGCLARLKIRTSTVIKTLVVPPKPIKDTTDFRNWYYLAGATVLGLVLGGTAGLLLNR